MKRFIAHLGLYFVYLLVALGLAHLFDVAPTLSIATLALALGVGTLLDDKTI